MEECELFSDQNAKLNQNYTISLYFSFFKLANLCWLKVAYSKCSQPNVSIFSVNYMRSFLFKLY